MQSIRFDDLTRDQLQTLAPTATVIVPIGSTEQHGPHLPTQVDTAIVDHLAQEAARVASESIPVLVTPVLPFGFAHHHLPFGGTVSISMRVYHDVLVDIATSLAADGFRRVLFLNGHGGNKAPMSQAVDQLIYGDSLDIHAAAASYWDVGATALAALDLEGAPAPGHAGSFETSCLLALRPDLVRTELIPAPEAELQPLAHGSSQAIIRHPDTWLISDGRTDDSRLASAELGHRVLAELVGELSRFIISFHHESNR
jgi:creatinine amidohydrolase